MPTQLRECLTALGWSQRGLACTLGIHEIRVRRWTRGLADMPSEVAAWLETLAAMHLRHPVPEGWARDAT